MAAYLMSASRKGISSVQLAGLLGVTQKTAWFVKHRIREAYAEVGGLLGSGVEWDEASAARSNKHKSK